MKLGKIKMKTLYSLLSILLVVNMDVYIVRNSNLYSKGAKAIIYSTCTGVKYAGNPLANRGTIIYKYLSTPQPLPPQTHGGSTILSLERKHLSYALVLRAFVRKHILKRNNLILHTCTDKRSINTDMLGKLGSVSASCEHTKRKKSLGYDTVIVIATSI
jgi:hypothetical protein